MTTEEIIFVTAFKDINRGDWEHYNRTIGGYIDYFYTLANNIKYKLIVYLENDIKYVIIKNKTFNENIIFEDLNNVDTFLNKFIENDKKIIESEKYKNKIPDYRKTSPEHLYSDYNLINHSKINFIRDTKEKNPNYLFYAWIDFGRMNESIDNIPIDIDISLLPTNKITYHFVNDPPLYKISEEEMLKSHTVYLLGSSYIVPHDLVEKFEYLFRKKLIEWHEKYITDDDQNLVLQLYFDNPELFYGIKNEKWYNMYANLRKNKIIETKNKKINIIVSRFQNNTEWVYKMENNNTTIMIYDKENQNNPYNVPLNRGNEASVYLKYIIDHYDCLSEYIFFIKDTEYSWHHEGSIIDRLKEAIDSNELYYNINNFILQDFNENNTETEKERLEWYNNYIEKYIPYNLLPKKNWVNGGYKGCAQFLVHKSLILNFSKNFYEDLYEWVINFRNSWLAAIYLEFSWHLFWDIYPKSIKSLLECKI